MSTATVSLIEIAAEWRTARRLYPFYSGLIRDFELDVAHCKDLENPVDRSDREVLDRIHKWFADVDQKVQVAQMRQLLQSQRFGEEETLRALLLRHIPQGVRDENLRDKLDYLLVQYFAAIAPHHPHDGEVTPAEVQQALRPVLGHVDLLGFPWVKELDDIAEAVDRCSTLAELLDSGLVELGRNKKRALGERYFEPAALVEITRFNFRLRLGFFRLMHSDLHSIRRAVQELENIGVATVDCREAGLGSAEPLATLRNLCHHWKKPFREAYRAGQSFRQLGIVRKILTNTVMAQWAKKAKAAGDSGTPNITRSDAPTAPPAFAPAATTDAGQAEESPSNNFDQILETISEQLFASKQKSTVSTVMLPHSKQVLASWEVNAFVRGGDASCKAIQRAVAARSLLAESAERVKSGAPTGLRAALQCAHVEAALIQEQVAKAKDRGDIDSAVGLAATGKRLLGVIEETEKLRA
ncbi:MAG TPA: hypothetical protein VJ453_14370 [Terriglobales bacterium]|jgi:hypothetical protein|nr:hypothetical protein [Terriglobales bacterium]